MATTQALVEMRGKPALSEVSALRAYLKVRIEDGSGKLFTGQKGPLRRWTLTRIFRSFCEQVSQSRVQRGMQPIAENAMHFHSLKHSIATILASRVDNIFGSEQESVKTCVFAGFLQGRAGGPPMVPSLAHQRYRPCFRAFYDTFHVRTCRDFFLHTIP